MTKAKMNRRNFTKYSTILATLPAFSFLPNNAIAANNLIDNFTGDWYSVLDAGAMQLGLRLEIINAQEANVYSLSQGNEKIPATKLSIINNKINLEFASIKAKFKGELKDGQINGIFKQGAKFPLNFTHDPNNAKTKVKIFQPLTQQYLDEILKTSGAPAIIATAQNLSANTPPLNLVSGVRELGKDTPATLSDNWHIGSITKSFTALLIGILVEKKILRWDEKISDTFGNYIKVPAAYNDVTLLHLLSHRAGFIANYSTIANLFGDNKGNIITQRKEYVIGTLSKKPVGKIGETFLYSNAGFVTAGHIAEYKTGKSWEELITEYIFKPLGINGGFGAPGNDNGDKNASIPTQPFGHAYNGISKNISPINPTTKFADNLPVIGPAGTININSADMLKYLKARAERNKIISIETWDKIETPPFGGDYALGVIKRNDGGIWHNGSNTMWYAEFVYYPRKENIGGKYGFAACNSGNLNAMPIRINEVLFSALAAV